MPRAGLSREVVVAAACRMVDQEGPHSLSITALAGQLGVRPPSLYNHVDGVEGLERLVALAGVDLLAEGFRAAVMGRTGKEALRALAVASRGLALEHPGVYALAQVARPGDHEYELKAARALEPVLAVLATYRLEGEEAIHATRILRSALHGFALLETQGGFGLGVDPGETFERLIETLDRGLSKG